MQKRYVYIDFLKTNAILAVIALHVSASLFYKFNTEPRDWWLIGNIVDSCARWAVPIFLLCSGALILSSKEMNIKNFILNRIKKIIIPLIFWSVIYYLYKNHFINIFFYKNIRSEIITFVQNASYYHLYFLYYLIGLYIISPILRIFLQNASKVEILYYIAIWFVGTVIYPTVQRFFGINFGIPLSTVNGIVGYYILGYYFHNFELSKNMKICVILFGLIGLVSTIVGTYILTLYSNVPNEYFYEYLNISVILSAVMVFISGKNINYSGSMNKFYSSISSYSFGIYLIHPIIMEQLSSKFGINYSFIHPIIGIPVSVICIFCLSYICVFFMKKVPIVKNVVP